MQNIITVKNIKIFAYHGCLEEEAKIGGNYLVNVELETDFLEAAINDDLKKTIDYVLINKIVKEEMSIRSKLIEEVGYRIKKRFEKELEKLHKLELEIIKLTPPINGDVESVSIIFREKYN
jgi:7,8-dihydroneopterin aldolase/epimerase/oxygenase